jgi:cyclohexa-1,5-dienecarbonyl-CoA hydratase
MIPEVASNSVLTSVEAGGSLIRVVLNRPKGNVLDLAMIGEIRSAVAGHARSPRVAAFLFEGQGPNFSFGASVEEHRGPSVEILLPAFHGLFRELAGSGKVLLAAVRGNCLGGGLELAAFCHRVFASPDAKLGCPEIRLGVFAPAASCVLPARVGQPAADDLLLTGRVLGAAEAAKIGLVDELADDPSAAALAWHGTHLQPHSAVALGHAVRAARGRFHRELLEDLHALERQYLDELRFSQDACEGIDAFLEKRPPAWTHR